jgi:FtsP/CotA-like multicopper oxidase with cupredoxin domain
VEDWRKGVCTAYPVVVDIPFIIAGDYVYHCHILEHEDGGMMARVFVRPSV